MLCVVPKHPVIGRLWWHSLGALEPILLSNPVVVSSHQVIRRSQTDSARPPAGKLVLKVQVPRLLDDSREQQLRQQRGVDGEGQAGSLYHDATRRGSFEGALQPLPLLATATAKGKLLQRQHAGDVSVTARFVVTYSGPGELRDATLNISPPPGFSAEPSSALLPPIRGTGNGGGAGASGGGGGGGSGQSEPQVIAVVLKAERGTGRLPSTLVGHASVVYTRQGTSGDGRSEPMSARCDLRIPLAMAGRVVEPSTRKGGGGSVHKFTFTTSRSAVRLSSLFEDMAMSPHTTAGGAGTAPSSATRAPSSFDDSKSGGAGAGGGPAGYGESGVGGAPVSSISDESTAFSLRYWAVAPDAQGGSQDVSVAVSKNSGRYRVQSESLPALCVIATEVVRRLREYFGEPGAGRDRDGQECPPATDEGKTNLDEGETAGTRRRLAVFCLLLPSMSTRVGMAFTWLCSMGFEVVLGRALGESFPFVFLEARREVGARDYPQSCPRIIISASDHLRSTSLPAPRRQGISATFASARSSLSAATLPSAPKRPRTRSGSCRLRIDYSEALPLQEFYSIIDDHFQRRGDLQSASEDLNRAAHQYRVVEKRLLSRFKDRNPAPLDNLDVVSEETYRRLVELCEGVERAQGRLAVSAANLGCAARLVALLAQHRFQLPSKDHALLLAHLFPDVVDTDDQVNERTNEG